MMRKGLNFSITTTKVPVLKILSSIETGIYGLSQSAKDTIRDSVANTLKTYKVPAVVNISKEEKRALDNLRKDEQVTIVPADKGRSVVVMDEDEYKQKVSVLFPLCPLYGETVTPSKTAQNLLIRSSNILSPVTKSWSLLTLNLYSLLFPWIYL